MRVRLSLQEANGQEKEIEVENGSAVSVMEVLNKAAATFGITLNSDNKVFVDGEQVTGNEMVEPDAYIVTTRSSQKGALV